MSASTVKTERRALRRAVGPELVSFTQETTQAIRLLQTSHQQIANDSQDLRRRLHRHEQQLEALRALTDGYLAARAERSLRSLWTRVKDWLVTDWNAGW